MWELQADIRATFKVEAASITYKCTNNTASHGMIISNSIELPIRITDFIVQYDVYITSYHP